MSREGGEGDEESSAQAYLKSIPVRAVVSSSLLFSSPYISMDLMGKKILNNRFLRPLLPLRPRRRSSRVNSDGRPGWPYLVDSGGGPVSQGSQTAGRDIDINNALDRRLYGHLDGKTKQTCTCNIRMLRIIRIPLPCAKRKANSECNAVST